MSHMRYGIVIETGDSNCSAYVPDLPGCIATGATIEESKQRIKEAIEAHLDGIREDGEAVPAPSTILDYVDVA